MWNLSQEVMYEFKLVFGIINFLNDDWFVFGGFFFSNSEQEDSGFWLGWSISLTKLDKCKYL